ncbi:MAG: hypothetical protein RLZZ556_418, partial [Actinomycetota bacterium]
VSAVAWNLSGVKNGPETGKTLNTVQKSVKRHD